jgi:N-acetylmuramic acid 6-phosphate etherase
MRPMTLEVDTSRQRFLGIEGGGSHTIALLADGNGQALQQIEAGPANLKWLSDAELVRHFRALSARLPCPDGLAIGLAGAWAESDWSRIRSAAAKVWPEIPCYATHDLETALTAADDGSAADGLARVLIVSGTGSACYGRKHGHGMIVGGWGQVLGDQGSGYDIGRRALQAVVEDYDRNGAWPRLGQRILRALLLNEPNALIDWAQAASKTEIAALAKEVFAARNDKDSIAAGILEEAAAGLARNAVTCARRVTRPGTRVQFVLTGSVLLRQPQFAAQVARQLRSLWPKAVVTPLKRQSVWGAVELARRSAGRERQQPAAGSRFEVSGPGRRQTAPASQPAPAAPHSTRLSPTEERNPRSMNLDKLPLRDAIALMLSEDARIPTRLLAQREPIERAIRAIVRAFRRGGRLFYVGAGTSGRLGVLDASECPPTFRTPPDLVQGIIAGGQPALWQSVEGAEDDTAASARALQIRGITSRDVVVGIAASGTTPFVWGALGRAKERGATTVLLCFNPYLQIPRAQRPTIVIAVDVGAELLTGSTRLKAGTATKLVLNMFTTLAMVQVGKVMSNLMVDLHPANVKLRDRAVRIVRELTQAERPAAQTALEQSGWVIKKAVARLKPKGRNLKSQI